MTFVGEINATSTTKTATSPAIPTSWPVGACMTALYTYADNNTPTFTDPAGWTLLGSLTHATGMTTRVYNRYVTTGDRSGTQTYAWTGSNAAKSNIQILCHDSVDSATFTQVFANKDETVTGFTHTSPTCTAVNGTALSFYSEKGSPGFANSTVTISGSGWTKRSEVNPIGGGAISSVIVEKTVVAGTIGGEVWTSPTSTNNANMWVVELKPAVATTAVSKDFSPKLNIKALAKKNFQTVSNILANTAIAYSSGRVQVGNTTTVNFNNAASGVVANSIGILFISCAINTTITTPAGWTLVATQVSGTSTTIGIFTRVQQNSDNGTSFTCTLGTACKWQATTVNYVQANATTPVDVQAIFNESVSGTAHSAGVGIVTITQAGDWVIEHAVVKGTTPAAWTGGPSNIRQHNEDTGGGALATATADANNTTGIGSYTGASWTSGLSTNNVQIAVVAIKNTTAVLSHVDKDFSPVSQIRRNQKKDFSPVANVLAKTTIVCLIDDEFYTTDSGMAQVLTEYVSDSISFTDDTTAVSLKARKDFRLMSNTRQLTGDDGFSIVCNILTNIASTQVSKDFTVLANVAINPNRLWTETDTATTTIWHEV